MTSVVPQPLTKREREIARRLGERMREADYERGVLAMDDQQLDAEERAWRKTHGVADHPGTPSPRIQRALDSVGEKLEAMGDEFELNEAADDAARATMLSVDPEKRARQLKERARQVAKNTKKAIKAVTRLAKERRSNTREEDAALDAELGDEDEEEQLDEQLGEEEPDEEDVGEATDDFGLADDEAAVRKTLPASPPPSAIERRVADAAFGLTGEVDDGNPNWLRHSTGGPPTWSPPEPP